MGRFSWLTIAVALLCAALVISVGYGRRERAERLRLEGNQNGLLEQLQGELRSFRVRDSLNAVSSGVLSLRVAEFERGCGQLSQLLRDVGLKIKRIETLSQSATRSRYEVAAPLRDTVMVVSGADVTAQTIHFADPYLSLDGVVHSGSFYGRVTSYDTLVHVVHRIPRRFLFFRWGVKELRQEVVSTNPHTQITYNRSVKITK